MAAALAVIARVGEGLTFLTLFESVMLMFRDIAMFKIDYNYNPAKVDY
jgi:hypothetical protein